MKRLSKFDRDVLVEAESRKVTRLFMDHASTPEKLEAGVEALEAHWRKVRESPVSKWIRFYILNWKSEILFRMGRLEEALVESNRSIPLPASPYARIVAAWARTKILRDLGRSTEAFDCAMGGMGICAKTRDVQSSTGLIREIVRLGNEDYLEELAEKYSKTILDAMRLPNEAQLIGPVRPETPIQALKALREAMKERKLQRQSGAKT
ncbi:MAG: hypothetical protein ACLPWF_18820 [Bryobacteraceae bacterium]|jgi:hypothetical protein